MVRTKGRKAKDRRRNPRARRRAMRKASSAAENVINEVTKHKLITVAGVKARVQRPSDAEYRLG
jgi:hypothetical protein